MDLDICERNAQISSETLGAQMYTCIAGISNRSIAGTNCHVIAFCQAAPPEYYMRDEQPSLPSAPSQQPRQQKILFWPAGGGSLDSEMLPRYGYSIAGTFSRWRPIEMEPEGSGVWGYTVVLGENRFERFYILLDGNRGRVLHPGMPEASMSTPVCGPEVALQALSWRIDDRAAKAAGAKVPAAAPGDRYRVRLRVSGKWRTVDWERLEKEPGMIESTLQEASEYQVVGNWSDEITPEAMVPAEGVPGLYTLEVVLPTRNAGNFQILRNWDWEQVIHPGKDRATSGEAAAGPDMNPKFCWQLLGMGGDAFRIEFRRTVEDGRDDMQVSWWHVGTREIPKAFQLARSRPQFHVRGNWGMSASPVMRWTGEFYQYFVQLGRRMTPSFHVQQDGDPRRCFYPSVQHAHPHEFHELQGPGFLPEGMCWTLGHDERDHATPGLFFEIRLIVRAQDGHCPERLDWRPVTDFDELEDASSRGFLAMMP